MSKPHPSHPPHSSFYGWSTGKKSVNFNSSMSAPPSLHFEYAFGCLIVRATGSAKFEQRIEFAEAIAAALKKQPVNALLINLRETTGPITFMERYELGELAAHYLPKIPIAVLMREEQTDRELIGRQVARNRGADLEVILEPAAADAWLKKYAALVA